MQYHIYRLFLNLLIYLPWWVLRGLHRLCTFCIHRVIGYRLAVVRDNIQRSFSSLSQEERLQIEGEFYHHLVGHFLFSPKMIYSGERLLREKYLDIVNLELFQELMKKGHKHFIILMGHCGNWELFSAGQVFFSTIGVQQVQLYRRLKNKSFDRLQREQRSRYGAVCIPKEDVGRMVINRLRDEEAPPTVYAFIADQTPRIEHVGIWTRFLDQDTAFLDGAERLARRYDLPVIYMKVIPREAYKYVGEMMLITENSKMTIGGEITQDYARLLEQNIREYPAHWLWSHKRWKFGRPTSFYVDDTV